MNLWKEWDIFSKELTVGFRNMVPEAERKASALPKWIPLSLLHDNEMKHRRSKVDIFTFLVVVSHLRRQRISLPIFSPLISFIKYSKKILPHCHITTFDKSIHRNMITFEQLKNNSWIFLFVRVNIKIFKLYIF